ncbi:glycoside hydrolase family 16 protein [Annulohypoxylon maeteangense]|uniref:glycoside hydrolase family 16 protein n=1 Tax=Annulohypoxylon maeteangense TaxID=1927788 RepID=UPI00200727A0|nr:glycoside hydrolase family 16 protein [Annulohypoxylon maeteangense]KAI0881921.1 glycoside hydrolase family 16 protein [Annulohypoxylon maeteangense]
MTSLRLLASLTILSNLVLADCECGYSIITASDNKRHLFTDILESDFVHLDITDGSQKYGEYGWARQDFNMSSDVARGPYGESYTPQNVISNNIANEQVFDGSGTKGGDAGLNLVVKSDIEDGMVTGADVSTTDTHYFHGTFRAGIKVTDIPGTCSAFFWYMNDTQEIDIEFLSSEFNRNNNTFPVNLVLQSQESKDAGFDASKTGDFKKINLSFDPTAAFHEYRIDFLPDRVLFYADAELLTEMNGTGVPSTAGNLQVSHWSNGNGGWSQGPPKSDATTTVSYVKAYFNSSLESRQNDYQMRCKDPSASTAVCAIPENNATFFFSNTDNMAPNQTTYHENSSGRSRQWWSLLFAAVLATSAWMVRI